MLGRASLGPALFAKLFRKQLQYADYIFRELHFDKTDMLGERLRLCFHDGGEDGNMRTCVIVRYHLFSQRDSGRSDKCHKLLLRQLRICISQRSLRVQRRLYRPDWWPMCSLCRGQVQEFIWVRALHTVCFWQIFNAWSYCM